MRKVVFICLIVFILMLMLIFCIDKYYCKELDEYIYIEYKKSDYIVNITPKFDFQQIVDYEGSNAIEFVINEDASGEIGKEIIVTLIKKELSNNGVDISSESILNNINIDIINGKHSGNDTYRIIAETKPMFICSKQDKLWNQIVENILGSKGVEIVIDKSSGKIYQCTLNDSKVDFVLNEKCAVYIANTIVFNNYIINKDKELYLKSMITTLNDAQGIAHENEENDSFYEICINPRLSLNYLIGLGDDKLLRNNSLIDLLKVNYKILLRKSNAEIIKIWKY